MFKKKALLLNTLSKESTVVLNSLRSLKDYTLLVPTALKTAPVFIEKNYNIVTLESLLLDHHQHSYKKPAPGEITLDGYPEHLRKSVEQLFLSRADIAATLIDALDLALESYDIRAFVTSNEAFIHERVLGCWAKARGIVGVHINHGFLMSPQFSAYQHTDCEYFFSASAYDTESYLGTSTHSEDCNPIETGLVHLDKYRLLIDQHDRESLFSTLNLDPELKLITFFPTIANTTHLKSKVDIHQKSLERSMVFAQYILEKHPDVAFAFKDRPSNEEFIKEQVSHLAKKHGIDCQRFRYVFDYAEPYIIHSEITISCASTVTIESIICGRPHLIFLEATGPVKLYPHHHIPLLDAEEMKDELDRLLSNPEQLEELTRLQQENTFDLVGHCGDGYSGIRASIELLKIINEPEALKNLEDDLSKHHAWLSAGNRISSDNLDDPLSDYWALVSLSSELDGRFQKSETAYQKWLRKTHIRELDGQLMAERLQKWRKQPTFHLIFCIDHSLFEALAQSLDSLDHQMYKNFGVSVISTASCPDAELTNHINMQWIVSPTPFSELNNVIKDVESDWVVIVQPGDILHPTALFNYADYANSNLDWMLMYGDEDHLEASSSSLSFDIDSLKRVRPIFKPDFNIDLLRSSSYIGRSCALRRDAILALQGLSSEFFLQTEQFAFQLAEQMDRPLIGHIPFILNHRSNTLNSFINSEYHDINSANLRLEHLKRCGYEQSRIQPGLYPSTYVARYSSFKEEKSEPVDLLVLFPTVDEHQIYETTTSLFRISSGYPFNLHIFVHQHEMVESWLESVWIDDVLPKNLYFHSVPEGINLPEIINKMVTSCNSKYFALVSADCHFVHPEWLERLMDPIYRPEIAMVGPRLVTPKGRIFSAGQIFGLQNQPVGDFLKGFFLEQEDQDMTRAWCDQNFNALNHTLLLIKRKLWIDFSGLDESFSGLLSITDLQIRMRSAGHLLLWSSQSTVALRGASYGYYSNFTIKDQDLIYSRWLSVMINDSAFNHNLSLSTSGTDPENEFAGKWHPNFVQRPRIFTAALNIEPYEFNHMNEHPFFDWMKKLRGDELIEYSGNTVFVGDERPELHPATLSLARTNANIVVYLGLPRGGQMLQHLHKHTKIVQLVIIRTASDLNAWLPHVSSLHAILVTEPFDSWKELLSHYFLTVEAPETLEHIALLYPNAEDAYEKLLGLLPDESAIEKKNSQST